MTLFWTKTWDALAGALFPTPCVSCGDLIRADEPPLCQRCWERLPRLRGARCRCGAALPGSPDEPCGRCRRGRSVILHGAALGPYEGPLRDCVMALKYGGRHRAAGILAGRLADDPRCREVLEGADVLIGVPLHPDRLQERGFNQADLLADALSRHLSVPSARSLVRTRKTASQTDLSARERRLNVRHAFAVRSGEEIRNAAVVLIDDVMTTGATLRECASSLLARGVREVRSLTVARAE